MICGVYLDELERVVEYEQIGDLLVLVVRQLVLQVLEALLEMRTPVLLQRVVYRLVSIVHCGCV